MILLDHSAPEIAEHIMEFAPWGHLSRGLLAIFWLYLAGFTWYYRKIEKRSSTVRTFRLITMIGALIIAVHNFALATVPLDHMPRIITLGIVDAVLWFAAGVWLLVQLWLSHETMLILDGSRSDD